MKKIIIVFILLIICARTFAQDTIKAQAQHVISIGCQFSPSREKSFDHDQHNISYQQPGYELLYKYLIPNRRPEFFTAISAGGFYRQGNGLYRTGGLGGYDLSTGNFQKADLMFGVTQYFRDQGTKSMSFDMGAGFSIGGLVYGHDKLHKTSYSAIQGTTESTTSGYLNSMYAAIHIEFELRLMLRPSYALMLGARQYLESGDGFGVGVNFTHTAFIAFSFR